MLPIISQSIVHESRVAFSPAVCPHGLTAFKLRTENRSTLRMDLGR